MEKCVPFFRCAVLRLENTFEKINVLDLRNSMNRGWAHPKHRKYEKKSVLIQLFFFSLTIHAGRCRNYRPRVSLVTSSNSLIHKLPQHRSSLQASRITTTLNFLNCSAVECKLLAGNITCLSETDTFSGRRIHLYITQSWGQFATYFNTDYYRFLFSLHNGLEAS